MSDNPKLSFIVKINNTNNIKNSNNNNNNQQSPIYDMITRVSIFFENNFGTNLVQ